jgi:choline dehydrogenase
MALNPLYEAFIRAGVEAGYPHTPDYNGHRQEGFGPMHMTVRKGVRESAATAYLQPALRRRNLRVVTGALTERVLLAGGTATGVRYRHRGRQETARCRKEVLLSAGAIGSPALLQRSGVGPPEVLRAAGVQPALERPGVGSNLQDHLEVYFQYECTKPITLNSRLGPLAKARIGTRWLLFRDGLGATNHFESCAFIRSAAGVKWPDIQYHFLPAAMRYDGRAALDGHGFQVHVGPNKPHSRGEVRIRSADAAEAPAIRFNYLQHPADVERWRRCMRLTREILAQPALDPYRGREVQPGTGVDSDEAIDAWVRAHVESAYHPCGTCRMGAADDPAAVVDPECRVIGVDGLRVVDASVFPTVPNGNINAPTIMLAEKASDRILGRAPLPPAEVPVWIDEGWQQRQRPNAPLRSVPNES